MPLLLIDDQGDVWDGQSRTLRQAFDSPYSGGEFSDYAVANLGFVALNTYGASCQIRLRPATISDRTFRAVCDWLHKSRNERVVLTWLDDDWTNELLRAGAPSTLRLEELIAGAKRSKPGDFLSRRLGPTDLPVGSPLRDLLENWAVLVRPESQSALMRLVELTLGQRHLMVKQNKDWGKLVFHSFGADLFSEYETWRSCAVGAPMEEMPDRAYGKQVAPGYYDALAECAPRVEEIDAIIRWPHNGRSRLRYKRIIIPMSTSKESTLLVGGSILDNRIDLRYRNV